MTIINGNPLVKGFDDFPRPFEQLEIQIGAANQGTGNVMLGIKAPRTDEYSI